MFPDMYHHLDRGKNRSLLFYLCPVTKRYCTTIPKMIFKIHLFYSCKSSLSFLWIYMSLEMFDWDDDVSKTYNILHVSVWRVAFMEAASMALILKHYKAYFDLWQKPKPFLFCFHFIPFHFISFGSGTVWTLNDLERKSFKSGSSPFFNVLYHSAVL